jgi:UPF0716 protein FxsA
MSQGVMPAMEMMEGLCLAIGGALLITPGFLTDSIGFICLIPVTRRALIRYIMANVSVKMGGIHGQQDLYTTSHENHSNRASNSDRPNVSSGRTFEGEYTKKDD